MARIDVKEQEYTPFLQVCLGQACEGHDITVSKLIVQLGLKEALPSCGGVQGACSRIAASKCDVLS